MQNISRRLAGTQHLPASFWPIFMNLLPNAQSEGGQAISHCPLSLFHRPFLEDDFFF